MATAVKIDLKPGTRADPEYLINADEFQRMVDAEILPSDRRIYLWDGKLYEKMGKNPPRAIAQNKLTRVLVRALTDGWHVSPENPVRVDIAKVPLPDMAVVRGEPDNYPKAPPRARDLALLVEVMDTSRKKDLRDNLQAYAAAGVRAYWVVDLNARVILCFSRPAKKLKETAAPGYRTSTRHGPGGSVTLEIPGPPPIHVPVDDILPAVSP